MFRFKGLSNEALRVIPVEENFAIRAPQKYTTTVIDGRNGSITEDLGYDNVVSSLELQILNIKRKDEILDWLNGSGELEVDGRVTTMTIYDEVAIVRQGGLYQTIVNYIRSPFWYTAKDCYSDISDTVITNVGTVYAEPTLRLEGKPGMKIDMTIGDVRFLYTFDSDRFVEIDCENKTETAHGFSKSNNIEIGFDYPKLYPGTTPVIVHSGNCAMKIKRKDRWL